MVMHIYKIQQADNTMYATTSKRTQTLLNHEDQRSVSVVNIKLAITENKDCHTVSEYWMSTQYLLS